MSGDTGHEPEETAGWRLARRPPPVAVLGSAAVHLAAAAILVAGSLTVRPPALPAQSYRVRLVAAADESAPMRLEPEPAKPAEEENRPPPPQPTPEPKPRTEVPTVVEEKPPPAEPVLEPSRAPETGDEAINVQLEGAAFVDPAYLQNIIRQVHRYWRPPSGGRHLRAEVVFVIERDGSVSEIDMVNRSGAMGFDLEARGAIEAAGRAKAFGPLPAAWPRERLRVSFFFDPTTR
ncbi:MAG: TonB C-terminal domain-containing protein [Gemmatimonadota bacterium]|nr:TonB C-terminal domain-containing protein [Gemmatimonadota bacterium]